MSFVQLAGLKGLVGLAEAAETGGGMMVDVTVASFEEMEPIFDGIARRARASLGVTGWGCN